MNRIGYGALIPGMGIHSPDDIVAFQDVISRESTILDTTASSCVNLDAPTLQAWRLQAYVPAQQYVQADVPSAVHVIDLNTMFEAGVSIKQTLDNWVAKLNASGCNVPITALNGTQNALDRWTTAAKIIGGVAIAVGVVAVIWKGEQIIEDVVR